MILRLIAAAFLALVVCTLSTEAQQKKTISSGTVEIYQNKDGEYRYRIKNAEGKTIAMPLPQMSWASKAEVMKAIQELKSILGTTPVEVKDGIDIKTKVEKTEKKTTEKKKTDPAK
jgi:uncharacterized protein YegP (UPF0339 family)